MKKNIDLIIDGIAPEKVMYDTDNHSLVVLYPAQRGFKKGDILAADNILMIFDKYEFNQENDLFYSLWNNMGIYNRTWTSKSFTYATDGQIAQLHKELREEGKKWNAETLQVEDLDISEIAVDLESACKYLKKPIPQLNQSYFMNADNDKFISQITLQLIREAWNKADGFVADWNDAEQVKYIPYFSLASGDLKCIDIYCEDEIIDANINYCFKTEERAIQFGTQFKELFKTAMGM